MLLSSSRGHWNENVSEPPSPTWKDTVPDDPSESIPPLRTKYAWLELAILLWGTVV